MNHPTDDHGLLQEIEEDLQRQKIEALWKRFGPHILGGAALIILVTALVVGWKAHKKEVAQERTAAYYDVLNKENVPLDEKIKELESYIEKNEDTALATLARLNEAALEIKSGAKEKGLALYEALAADSSVDPVFRSLSQLIVVQIQFDTATPAELETRLQPLIVEGEPWRFPAMELAGHLAVRMGDRTKAKALFNTLATAQGVPESMADRARDMVSWIEGGI